MSPAVSSAVHPRGGSGVGSGVASVLLMGSIVRPPGIPCYCLGMVETGAAITENPGLGTVSERELIVDLRNQLDHVDAVAHEIQQTAGRLEATVEVMRAQLAEVHAELEAARPMIERAMHSRIVKLASGAGMPWAKQ